MTLKQALDKAIAEGYQPPYSKVNGQQTDLILQESVLLDPKFFQALGKSMGWGYTYECPVCFSFESGWNSKLGDPVWLEKWYKLVDHLAEGGTIQSYFEALT